MTSKQATAQVLNWLIWYLPVGEKVEIRLPNPLGETVYVVGLLKHDIKGLKVQYIRNVPVLFGKILHHWNYNITYQTLNASEIRLSIECADILNSFHDELENRQIDELVNEAMLLDLPEFDEALFYVCM